jgi:poly(3-hydroxybutyrate) depolymerase
MFSFLSQRNKKCTSLLKAWGVEPHPLEGARRPWTSEPNLGMLYLAYQLQSDIMMPVRAWASMAVNSGSPPFFVDHLAMRHLTAAYELVSRAGLSHTRPPFGIGSVTVGNRDIEVREEAVLTTPFGTLLHFKKDVATEQPRVLLVAPLSGHFATLLRATVKTMLPDHDVYITDWHNARDVPLTAGRFGVDEYTDHIIKFLEALGPGAHVLAVCQPCVAVLAAVAVMAQAGNPAQPRSMTLMAGPIDTRVNPTTVNDLAKKQSIDWFERTLTTSVPLGYPGAFRRVYPGFMQLVAFMSMNLERHVKAHKELYENLANGEYEKAAVTKAFYDEYFAVLDLTAEFYLETVQLIFQEHALPLGNLEWHGEKVDPSAIRKTMLLTVEGERDDICAVGQTVAAHDLCNKLRPYLKRHHMQAGVGHYGVFSGKRWESQVYPIVKNVILSCD